MPRQGSCERVPDTFQEVAACFSKEEWKLLHTWQEELFKTVMKEIHSALISLGPVIASSVFSLKSKGKDSLSHVKGQDSERRRDDSQSAASIGREESQHPQGALHTEEREISDHPGTGCGTVMGVMPDSIKEETFTWEVGYKDPNQQNLPSSTGMADGTAIKSFHEESEGAAGSMHHTPTAGRGSIEGPTGHGTIMRTMSESIKEEEEIGPTAHTSETESLTGKEYCTSSFRGKPFSHSEVYYHQQMHTGARPFPCTMCEKSFTQKAYLVQHLRFHAATRPFRCPECQKSFKLKNDLQRHQRTHTGVRPFLCTVCEKSFTRKTSLLNHQTIHTGVRPFPCTECGKSFSNKTDLHYHQRIHTCLRPFLCSLCQKTFKLKNDLQRHLSNHALVRRFPCTECEKSFTRKTNLIQHQKIHSGVKPYPCNECEKSFTRRTNLLRHQRIHSSLSSESPYSSEAFPRDHVSQDFC